MLSRSLLVQHPLSSSPPLLPYCFDLPAFLFALFVSWLFVSLLSTYKIPLATSWIAELLVVGPLGLEGRAVWEPIQAQDSPFPGFLASCPEPQSTKIVPAQPEGNKKSLIMITMSLFKLYTWRAGEGRANDLSGQSISCWSRCC